MLMLNRNIKISGKARKATGDRTMLMLNDKLYQIQDIMDLRETVQC